MYFHEVYTEQYIFKDSMGSLVLVFLAVIIVDPFVFDYDRYLLELPEDCLRSRKTLRLRMISCCFLKSWKASRR